jgi:hypothetical protein
MVRLEAYEGAGRVVACARSCPNAHAKTVVGRHPGMCIGPVTCAWAATKGRSNKPHKHWQPKGTDVTWVGISGSWRYAPPGLADAVRREVAAACSLWNLSSC